MDLWLRRDNSAGLGFKLLEGKALAVGFPVRIGCSGCWVWTVGLQFSGGEGSEGVSFCAVGWVIRKQRSLLWQDCAVVALE